MTSLCSLPGLASCYARSVTWKHRLALLGFAHTLPSTWNSVPCLARSMSWSPATPTAPNSDLPLCPSSRYHVIITLGLRGKEEGVSQGRDCRPRVARPGRGSAKAYQRVNSAPSAPAGGRLCPEAVLTSRNQAPALSLFSSAQEKSLLWSLIRAGNTEATSVVLLRCSSCMRKGTPSELRAQGM